MERLSNILKSVSGLLFPARLKYALAAVTALVAISAMSLTALAQTPGTTVKGVPNVVLVHGSWADGSSWGAVIELLQKAGYKVTAVQLSENSLAEDTARVRRVLAEQTGPTLLAAHSYGGAVISQLGADAPNVKGLVYIAAFAPDEGETAADLLGAGPPSPAIASAYPDKAGYLYLSEDGFVNHFAADIDPVQARVLYAVQQPINSAIFGEAFGPPAWKSFPSWFLIAEEDQVIPPVGQQFMSARMKATVSSVKSGHVIMISHPDVVANLIDTAASSLVPDPRPNIMPTPTAAPPTIPGSGSQTFSETGKTVSGIFLDYWKTNGGLAQQGFPISDLMSEKSPLDGKTYTVQYFERAVFEYHPENQAPNNVLLSQLGTFRYQQLYADSASTR